MSIKATAYSFRAHGTLECRGIAQFGLVGRVIRKLPECSKAYFAIQQLWLSGCRLRLCTWLLSCYLGFWFCWDFGSGLLRG
ncbi:hypothetical protein HMPREF1257_00185 [Corynebacterium sp. KPL1814]|nr:hypothetical protein HMPREF1281_00184 [Corynebacterium sp. KPL1855]ERS64736.1 hypothetical protein HMPREF1257_00185 [Corynebacterium sp. KPL1814]ERS80266.1 hypothetical protein HMPREF1285_00614 [Corynebacterium sp. KPL1859]